MISFDSPKLDDRAAFSSESLRIYDICNGCRRCFNLCPSFDVLFQGIDEKDGEVSVVEPNVQHQIIDLCYYCKLCFNHCPYCPPHQYNLDFPRLMLWGKHLRAKEKRPNLRDRLLANVERIGRLGGLVAPLLNWANRNHPFRWILEKIMGIHRERLLPNFHTQTFSTWFRRSVSPPATKSESSEKVALFYTCYVNHHAPEVGQATIQVLQKNQVDVICPQQQCCGMPFFDTGDMQTVLQKAKTNLSALSKAVDAGYKIVSPMPTCSLMLKKEYPDLIGTEEAKKVAANTYDLCEYLMTLESQGRLSKDFVSNPGQIAYQIPCHLRDQNIGYKTRDLMKLIPGAQIEVIEKCSGHDGAFGVKKEYYPLSLKVGRKAISAIESSNADLVVSDCSLSSLALRQETEKITMHPIEVLKHAYGIKP
jgi:glycerol-3-phosphate dehydrogenase subunit C